MKHAEILENEVINKIIDDAHDLSLLLTECQCTEMIMRLMLIQK